MRSVRSKQQESNLFITVTVAIFVQVCRIIYTKHKSNPRQKVVRRQHPAYWIFKSPVITICYQIINQDYTVVEMFVNEINTQNTNSF